MKKVAQASAAATMPSSEAVVSSTTNQTADTAKQPSTSTSTGASAADSDLAARPTKRTATNQHSDGATAPDAAPSSDAKTNRRAN